ncbi:signal recognition particle-docking protein FtsY [Synechococcus sp. UW140]|uniref:signal recognition particle-docking protein FtsY n=1 Tax=Synechococcus sp. UW140 TaxID=368503 RepID=UPI0031377580
MSEFDWFQRPTPEAEAAEDALAWAKEAYARLKAQQQGSQPEVETVEKVEAVKEVEIFEEPKPTEDPKLEEPKPVVSLLEQAAAKREERLASLAQEAPPAEPELGQLDADFLWSAEVLAAQGRSAAQVSIEEIDWLAKLRAGMEKTRQGFVTQLLENLGDDPLSEKSLEEIESLLLRADVGVESTDQSLDRLRKRMNEGVLDATEALGLLKQELREQLEKPLSNKGVLPLLAPDKNQLNIWLIVGVNGVGKTTTLGKLANLAVRSGYSCLVAAGDTFRAAAVQQLQVWAERSGVTVIANPSANADPAAVVFDAIGAARSKNIELLLVDTAGRLQTKHNLMEELAKVRRIIDRLAPEAKVESLLVLDASQGQNGLRQAMAFAAAAQLTGVVLTKLDGSARGGVALAVAAETGLPIRFIGAGEGIKDLRPFNSFEFVEALLARN